MRYEKLDLYQVAKDFKNYVRDRRHFRNREINSTIIAKKIGVSRTILSRAVNQELGMTVNEFINQERVKYINKQIQNNDRGHTIEEIILLSGFSCPSTYYRYIKHVQG